MNCTDIVTLSPLYISGELDRARADAFAAHLRSCPECAREIQRQIDMDALLRTGILAEAPDTSALDNRVREQIAAAPASDRQVASRWLLVAAGIVLVLLVAGLGYRALLGMRPSRLYTDAARDHRSEVINRQPRRWLADPAALESLAEQRGVSRAAVASLAPSGYRPEHGKLCRLDGRIFLHLVYTDGAHEFSVFLRERDADPLPGPARDTLNGRSLHVADFGDEHLSCFQTDRLRAMLVTDQPGETALALARLAAAVL
ncbi:MAG: zf-HC2 domain-containing protein [Acidobacteriia bacterium]|nr:zf-HC2 domain-containing protein [Terriglobia bacterium]